METKQASWLEGLTDETRERVFVAMRKIRADADRYLETGNWLGRGTGMSIPVGAAHFDEIIRGEGLATYLRALGKGMCPTEAIEYAKADARSIIKSHNNRRPKDIYWQRADMAADSKIEYAHRLITNAVMNR